MPRKRKPRVGRPPLGDDARTISVLVRLTVDEHAEVAAKVERHNANLKDGQRPTTVTAWIRDRGLT